MTLYNEKTIEKHNRSGEINKSSLPSFSAFIWADTEE